jgi:predicted Zn-dependent protease
MESRSNKSVPKARRRARILLAILGATALLLAAWWSWPGVDYRIRLHLAERAVEADRLDEAEERLDLLIAERPAKTWPRFLRARVARKRGQITRAEELLQRAIELGLPVEQARREHQLLVEGAAGDQRSAVRPEKSVIAEGEIQRK